VSILYYPQLPSGAIAQFPIHRVESHRTIINWLADGGNVREADHGFGAVRWQLSYSHLTEQECGALQTLFEAAQGRLNPFVFTDPTDNLLLWSADLTNPAWSVGPLITLEGGQPDPNSGTGAFQLTNTGQAAQGIRQSIIAPGSLLYCFSVFIRSESAASVEMSISNQTSRTAQDVTATPEWRRVALSGSLSGGDPPLLFGITLAPGERASVFGPQVEAQRAPSLYKATTGRGGTYPNSRFDSDSLELTATGVNQYSATISVVSLLAD
jgi:hypothetical protein